MWWERHTLWTDDQATTLLGATVDGFNDIDQLLLILEDPVELIVVTGSEITHHMLVSKEEHESDWVVELVHLLEVWDLVEVADVDNGEVLDAIGNACYMLENSYCALNSCQRTVENLVLAHAVRVPVAAESDDDKALLFGEDGLVDVPASDQVRKNNRSHCCGEIRVVW